MSGDGVIAQPTLSAPKARTSGAKHRVTPVTCQKLFSEYHAFIGVGGSEGVTECVQCGATIIAPEWSEHRSERCVRNVWSCEACGYQFEHTAHLLVGELADVD